MIEFTFDTDFILDNKKQISDWLLSLANNEGFNIKNLHYNFVSAEKIQSINNQFLNHDYPTDVIAFDYCVDKELSGEVFVCQKIVEQKPFTIHKLLKMKHLGFCVMRSFISAAIKTTTVMTWLL